MEHFLALTLAGRLPHHFHGETAHFRWHWLGEGILELTPHARCERGLVLSCAIHGNETAPVEIVDQLVQRLVREALPLRWRLLVIVGNPPALRANKRFVGLAWLAAKRIAKRANSCCHDSRYEPHVWRALAAVSAQ